MRPHVVILILLIAGFVGWRLYEYYVAVENEPAGKEEKAIADIRPESLPGLPYQLEQKLHDAQAAGPEAFKAFVESLKNYPDVKDPRLAWIELDYVVMIGARNPVEARKLFVKIRTRTPADSPVMPRIRALAKTYEP